MITTRDPKNLSHILKGSVSQCQACAILFHVETQLYSVYGTISSLPVCVVVLITFANSLDPDQNRQNVGPSHDIKFKLLVTQTVFLKDVFKRAFNVAKTRTGQNHVTLPSMQRVKIAKIKALASTNNDNTEDIYTKEAPVHISGKCSTGSTSAYEISIYIPLFTN